jgi:hypothetical protein
MAGSAGGVCDAHPFPTLAKAWRVEKVMANSSAGRICCRNQIIEKGAHL